jgi:hypothetical protein
MGCPWQEASPSADAVDRIGSWASPEAGKDLPSKPRTLIGSYTVDLNALLCVTISHVHESITLLQTVIGSQSVV